MAIWTQPMHTHNLTQAQDQEVTRWIQSRISLASKPCTPGKHGTSTCLDRRYSSVIQGFVIFVRDLFFSITGLGYIKDHLSNLDQICNTSYHMNSITEVTWIISLKVHSPHLYLGWGWSLCCWLNRDGGCELSTIYDSLLETPISTRSPPTASSRSESVGRNSTTIRWGLRRISPKYSVQKCKCFLISYKLPLMFSTNMCNTFLCCYFYLSNTHRKNFENQG